ncbi:unnamed protein product [Ranitomeya imitator]|uniref:Ig-like domain-containing protein n=1 Tax=Ranitomeya imitator TaxID=111125 RepID=A0ABN9LB70_9NEOB|nr:unnamed protein product [Ranitomeya imitator]
MVKACKLPFLNTEFGAHVTHEYEGRVKEKSPLKPEDGTIILKNVVQADEGVYQCRVYTFPAGTFEADVTLKVLVFQQEKRITHVLEVEYLADVTIQGHDQWFVGKNDAALKCFCEGHPNPQYTWFRVNGSLQEDVKTEGDQLKFTSPLRTEDTGVYICEATNRVSSRQASVTVTITVMATVGEGWYKQHNKDTLIALCGMRQIDNTGKNKSQLIAALVQLEIAQSPADAEASPCANGAAAEVQLDPHLQMAMEHLDANYRDGRLRLI